jgi:hypothetical protein
MDPTLAPGELGKITGLDQTAFDVIGYNLITKVVATAPEPGTLGLMGIPLMGGALVVARKRRLRP